MIFSTTPSDPRRAFTLVEVLIAVSISSIVLAGVLSSFLMLGRSGANLAGYTESETQIRRALEEFSQDVRMASNIVWNSATSVTLTVPNNYTTSTPTPNLVTYAYDSATSGATSLCFYRRPGDLASTAAATVFVRDISTFTFTRYNRLDATAASDAETKRVQITLNVRKTGRTLVAANTTLVSASYTLRNKPAN